MQKPQAMHSATPNFRPEIAHTGRCRLHARSFAFHRRSLTAASFHRSFRSNCEIHLPLEGIDPHDENAHLIAYAESFARSSADELPSSRLEQIKVVRQRRDMDET